MPCQGLGREVACSHFSPNCLLHTPSPLFHALSSSSLPKAKKIENIKPGHLTLWINSWGCLYYAILPLEGNSF